MAAVWTFFCFGPSISLFFPPVLMTLSHLFHSGGAFYFPGKERRKKKSVQKNQKELSDFVRPDLVSPPAPVKH